MKLRIDHNLSLRLVRKLEDLFPSSVHVRSLQLGRANDDVVWHCALDHGLTIVSKDADFHQLSFVRGHPPKVVWIRRGNCSTEEVEDLLRSAHPGIREIETSREASFLALD